MKKTKKFAVVLSLIMICTMLTGCLDKFDPSAYLKAVLDNSYKNDSTGYVEQNITDKEEAEKVYNEGIDTTLSDLTAGLKGCSDEVLDEYKVFVKDLFKAADYTVKDSKAQDDGSYLVTVEYRQLKVFEAAAGSYAELLASFNYDDYDSEEEAFNALYKSILDCLNEALKNAEYADPQTTTVTLTSVNNVYTPATTDLINLEKLLFDFDAMQ